MERSARGFFAASASLALATILVGCSSDELIGRCSVGYELVGGKCVLICEAGYRAEGDTCVALCESGFEWRDGGCYCPAGQEPLDGACVATCPAETERVGTDCIATCPEGSERVGDDCVTACEPGYIRNDAGECVLDCPEGYKVVDTSCVLDCAEGYEPQGDTCVLVCEPGQIAQGDTCVSPGAISGAMCDLASGTWLSGLVVSITLPNGQSLATITDTNGAFRLDAVPPGEYTVAFEGPTYTNSLPAEVVAGSETIIGFATCDAPPGHLRGGVCDELTGEWVNGAVITLNDAATTTTTTDAQGVFIFLDVPPGDYMLTVSYPDGRTEQRNAIVLSSQITELGPVTCDPPLDLCETNEPVAQAGPDVSAVPNQLVNLDGGTSYNPGGGAITYQWRVASQPLGSTAALSNPGGQTTHILADVAGDFVVCLEVANANGCESPEDCLTIHVAPLVDLHIELVWMKDDSDLDLHYKRPGASWFGVGDVFYDTPGMTEDWAPTGPAGNPVLDVDNTYGFGPENINVNTLADGGPFTVGVHYYSNDGAGSVSTRVRIFANGALQFEATRALTQCDQMWTVAQVNVSGSGTAVSVTSINSVQNGARWPFLSPGICTN